MLIHLNFAQRFGKVSGLIMIIYSFALLWYIFHILSGFASVSSEKRGLLFKVLWFNRSPPPNPSPGTRKEKWNLIDSEASVKQPGGKNWNCSVIGGGCGCGNHLFWLRIDLFCYINEHFTVLLSGTLLESLRFQWDNLERILKNQSCNDSLLKRML